MDGRSAVRRYTRYNGRQDMVRPEFDTNHRITLLSCISADGETAPPLFVFKGHRHSYREVASGDIVHYETYHSHLPRGAVVAVRDEQGGVDSENFLSWARRFVSHVHDLTSGGRKVLLTYDAYRAHMTVRVLELLRSSAIIAYAIPAHTSGKLQPCDVVLFGEFKKAMNKALAKVVRPGMNTSLDVYQTCRLLKYAYHEAVTHRNILSSFRRSGVWPVDATRIIRLPRPKDDDDLATIIKPEELIKMLEKKREMARREVLGDAVNVLRCGYISTRRGEVFTSDEALTAARKQARLFRERKVQKDIDKARRELASAKRHSKARVLAAEKKHKQAARKAVAAGRTIPPYHKPIRTMRERRAQAKLRTALIRGGRAAVAKTEHTGVALRLRLRPPSASNEDA